MTITTVCAHCEEPLQITVDSDLRWHVANSEAEPLMFEPSIDWQQFTAPTIIEAY